jgi:RNA polymerase sigma-70 factor (ECF subfamily)
MSELSKAVTSGVLVTETTTLPSRPGATLADDVPPSAKTPDDPADWPQATDPADDSEKLDSALEAAVRAQDFLRAIELCAQLHGPGLGRFCTALVGDAAEAEEIAQETLLGAFESFATFRAESSVRSWLFGIARKKCLKLLEGRRRAHKHRPTVEELARQSGVAGGEQWTELARRSAAARAALGRVRPSEREALLLRYVAEMSYRDIAAVFDVDEAAARKRVSRGLQQLRSIVAQTGELGNETEPS